MKSVSVPVAALPVPYRTHYGQPTMQSLVDERLGVRAFPVASDALTCDPFEIANFARLADDTGVRYLNLCCGAAPHHIRGLAEALGRTPLASR